MPKYSDETGVWPTCPLIDEVISYVQNLSDNYSQEIGGTMATEGLVIIAVLEKIRSSNSDLRDFGNKMYSEKNEAEKDRDYYEREMNNYRNELEDLKNEYQSLQKEIDIAEKNNLTLFEELETLKYEIESTR